MIGGHPILERMRTTRVLGHVAADGAGLLAGGIRRVLKTLLLDRIAHPQIHHSRLSDDVTVEQINVHDPVHAAGADHDRGLYRQTTTAQAGSSAAGNKGDLLLVKKLDDCCHFFGRTREDDDLRSGFLQGVAIAFVDGECSRLHDYAVRANNVAERRDESRVHKDLPQIKVLSSDSHTAGLRRIMRFTVYSNSTSPFWLMTCCAEVTTPRSGFEVSRLARTLTLMCTVSPQRRGAGIFIS